MFDVDFAITEIKTALVRKDISHIEFRNEDEASAAHIGFTKI